MYIIIIIIIKVTADIHRKMHTLGQRPVAESLQWQRILTITLPEMSLGLEFKVQFQCHFYYHYWTGIGNIDFVLLSRNIEYTVTYRES